MLKILKQGPFKNKVVRDWAIDTLSIVMGSLAYALSINLLLKPYHIAPGGAGGLAMIINYLTGFPIGMMIIIINIPLFVVGRKLLGKKFFVKTLIATVLVSVFVDAFAFLNPIGDDVLLASIFSGVLMGIGFGFMFMRGATTGGSDILAVIFKKRFPHISVGNFVIAIDTIIIALSAVAYRDIDSAFYAAISLFVSARVLDTMLDGASYAKLLYIISDHQKEIADRFIHELDRGVTILKATGAYTGADRNVLLIAIRRHQIFFAKQIVRDADPDAFMILTDATEVFGNGFTKEP